MTTSRLPVLQTAAPLIPPRPTLKKLASVAAGCTACPLYKCGTQTVFGEGPAHAPLMLVGEQPGNDEDLEGHPFVGPAGKLLRSAMDEAGIDVKHTYLTNVVKHFKWEPRGKRRLHKRPHEKEVMACRPWLEAEISVVKPEAILFLGATAAQAMLGKKFKVTEQRGKVLTSELAPLVMATVHPSSILRSPDSESRRLAMKMFVADLRKLAKAMQRHAMAA